VIFGLTVRTAARIAAAAVLMTGMSCGAPPATTPSIEPSASATPTASVFVATAIPTPRTTPPGTPAPHPTAAIAQSADVTKPPMPTGAPTPSVEPGLWRIDGYVVDEAGAPLAAACIVIGPVGCQLWSPKTDDRGYWFIDVAQARSTFDIFFERPGHKSVWWRVIPEGPIEFNVVLPKG
jgi:hypothetical protein